MAFSIVCIFITVSYALIGQASTLSHKSRDYYQISKTAQSIIEELKCYRVISHEEKLEVLDEDLEEGFHFSRNKYSIEMIGERLSDDTSLYLIKISITEEESETSYLLYSLINSKKQDSYYPDVYYELEIQDWEIYE